MNFENTIFGKIPGGERSSFIIGKYFSYCLIFSKIECRDDKNYEMDLSSTMMLKLFINDYLRKFKIEKKDRTQTRRHVYDKLANVNHSRMWSRGLTNHFYFFIFIHLTFQIYFMRKIEKITL